MTKNALVLDDIDFIRKTVRNYLSFSGFNVDIAENGAAGIKFMAEKKYDLIVSDIEMPIMNGLEFLKRIKKNAEYINIPVIMLTSLNDKDTLDTAKLLGAKCHIPKPFNPDIINSALKSIGF
jgi:two-component system chemotaxis response regulator CheY